MSRDNSASAIRNEAGVSWHLNCKRTSFQVIER